MNIVYIKKPQETQHEHELETKMRRRHLERESDSIQYNPV
jgi:hypothetical protein